MINFLITYIDNKKAALLEQAAGFPPFTRGYSAINKQVEIKKRTNTHFTLTDYSDSSILNLFTQIISHQVKSEITLNIPFNGTTNEIVCLRVLRTLLAFVSDKLYGNPSIATFEFYGTMTNEIVSINTLIFANASQLDVLMVSNIEKLKTIQQLIIPIPMDAFYGSSNLEKETSLLFFRLWKQIVIILS